jgi:endonuclease/exonuclease/phosphatase family metal-dependent hydrolase
VLFKNNLETGLAIVSKIETDKYSFHLCNFFGRSRPGHKKDTKERIFQSKEIIKYFKKIKGPKIIGGDFNVDKNTQSIGLFEKAGYVNLVEKHGIETTRNKFVWEKFPGNEIYFSDYVFVSPDIKVTSFVVPKIDVSDHLPIELKIHI